MLVKASILVRALCLYSISAACAFAQNPAAELQELKAKVQQLQEQIARIEQSLKAQSARATPPPANVPITPLPTTYIGKETRQRQTVSEFPEEAPRIDNEELDPTLRGFFRIPGTRTLANLRGFVKTDLFYDLNMAGFWYGGMVPSSFPSSPQPKSRNSTVSIRPSRFVVEFRQPLGNDTLKGFVDWDLYGTNGRNTPNVRSFWGQYKNFLAGQTWSAFGDPDAFPDTLDFHGAPGMMGLRTPQFRYTQPLNHHNWIGLTVEKSGTDVPFFTQFGVPEPSSLRPDFVLFYRYENNYGHIHAATIFRSVGGFVPNTTVPDLREHVNGYGASVSGSWRLGRLRDTIVFQGIGGKGIANYYNDNYGLGSDVGFDAEGRLVATPTWSSTFGYQHYWTKIVRSTVSYGYLRINNTAADPGTNYHVSNYASGNIIIQPSALYLFGAEYIYASLRRKDDFKWVAPRFQASVTFFLNRPQEQ